LNTTRIFELNRESNFHFLLRYLYRHKWSYSMGVVMLFATNWLAVNIPRYIANSIDILDNKLANNLSELNTNILLIVILGGAMIVARTISRLLFCNPGRAIERDLKNEAFQRLTYLQRGCFREHLTGTLISIVSNDITGIRALAGIVMLQ